MIVFPAIIIVGNKVKYMELYEYHRYNECERILEEVNMYIDLLVLHLIERCPMYGYEIKKTIQNQLGEVIDVNHNLLYPSLRKFEQKGAIVKKVSEQEGRPNRHVYYITDKGKEFLSEMVRDFHPKNAKNDIEFMVRVALFDRIHKEDRLRILNLRKQHINKLLLRKQTNVEKNEYINEVLQFSTNRFQNELAWIDNLILKVQ
jgi:DNA-binding PadR family transcriptional regulator